MTDSLRVSVGQYSSAGRKSCNQDCHGLVVPGEPGLSLKGVALAMADGISTSDVGQIASETAVKTFLEDYFCTSETWTVRTSATRVLAAINSWLNAQTLKCGRRFERDRGYVCTLSALVIKAATAHILHVGDTRIYRVRQQGLELLTNDHRLRVSREESYLSRALGFEAQVEPDYRALPVAAGETFVLATDGVYEHVEAGSVVRCIDEAGEDLDGAARAIVEQALDNGSPDNLSVQILRVDAVPGRAAGHLQRTLEELPLPPTLGPGVEFDGYRVLRELHISARSHAWLALDLASDQQVVLKTPSVDLCGDPEYLERFMLEEWIARRINSPHVVRAMPPDRQRHYLYTALEYIEGRTLAQWLQDHPCPDLETVRDIAEQVAKGLRAFHRREMLHQDLRPENVMLDREGTAKIIDFGAVRVAGLLELTGGADRNPVPGTALYTAPEYFLGEPGTARSDQFSLGVLTYHMLSGRYPYGTRVARARTAAAQRRLRYRSLIDDDRELPAWVDAAIQRAVHINPLKRYEAISEFLQDLRHPNRAWLQRTRAPLMERHPVAVWQGIALIQLIIILALLANQLSP